MCGHDRIIEPSNALIYPSEIISQTGHKSGHKSGLYCVSSQDGSITENSEILANTTVAGLDGRAPFVSQIGKFLQDT